MTQEIKQLNAVAVHQVTKFSAEVDAGDNGENAKTVPVKILARTSDPVYIEELDLYMVHDFDTMKNKSRLPLDYAHDQYQNIGYLNKIELKDYTLTCSGAIVPYSPNPLDPAAEVVFKMRAGVPYEASIQTDMGDISYADDGSLVTLNGRNYAGFSPLYVMSNFELVAVAVCKLGRDPSTSTQLLSKGIGEAKPVEVKITKRENLMSTEDKPAVETVENPFTPVVEVSEPVEAPQVEAPVVEKTEVVETAPEVKPVEGNPAVPVVEVPVTNSAPVADPASVAKQYMTLFGATEGMTYLAAGLSVEDAKTQCITALKAQVADLTQRLSAVDRGSPTPVQFCAAPRDDVPAPKKGYAALVNLGKSKK